MNRVLAGDTPCEIPLSFFQEVVSFFLSFLFLVFAKSFSCWWSIVPVHEFILVSLSFSLWWKVSWTRNRESTSPNLLSCFLFFSFDSLFHPSQDTDISLINSRKAASSHAKEKTRRPQDDPAWTDSQSFLGFRDRFPVDRQLHRAYPVNSPHEWSTS